MPDSPIRLMVLVDSLMRGGVPTHLKMLLPALAARGVPVCVVCLERDEVVGAELEAMGIPVRRFRIRKLRSRMALDALFSIRASIRAEGWNVIASYLFSACFLGSILRRITPGVRHLVAWRDTGFWLTGYYRPCMTWISRLADGLTANSDAVECAVEQYLGRRHPRIWRVPNAVTLPPQAALPGAGFHIGMVGRCSREKGPDVFVDAMAHLRDAGRDFTATLAGDGPEYAAVRERVEALRLEDRVALPGMVLDTEGLYRSLRLLCVPSRSEGFSNAVLEGMSYGVPVVASAVGGNPELVSDRTGRLFETENAPALAREIMWCMDHPAECAAMGAAARERVAREYSPNVQCAAMLAALRGVLGVPDGISSTP